MKKSKIIYYRLIGLLCLILTFNFSANSCCTLPLWTNASGITIDNTGGAALNNHKLLILFDTKTAITAGNMKADGSDIRILDDDCKTELKYWISDKGANLINTTTTEIWVLVPSILANSTKSITLFYGNAAATPQSAFANIFTTSKIVAGTEQLAGPLNFDWVEIPAGATLKPVAGTILEINATKVLISGTIDGNFLGYGPGVGPGIVGSDPIDGGSKNGGSGGAYGGDGGHGGIPADVPLAYGTPNGTDIHMGSGGGGSVDPSLPALPPFIIHFPADASGGGGIKITSNTTEILGTINLNGQDAGDCNGSGSNSECVGGGAGGGLLIQSDFIIGSGNINSNGGKGGSSQSDEGGGGGAGGRVKLLYGQTENYSGAVSILGGLKGSSAAGKNIGTDGQLGTVSKTKATQTEPTVTINASSTISADFTAVTSCLGTPTTFTDKSTPAGAITSWKWTLLHDNTVLNGKNQTYTYPASGSYQVKLEVAAPGCTAETTKTINIGASGGSKADFHAPDVCFGQPTTFTDLSTSASGLSVKGWTWNYGDTQTSPDDKTQNPVHTYATTGPFEVTLEFSEDGCKNSVKKTINVHPLPLANFDPVDGCQNQLITFTDKSTIAAPYKISSWNWDFDNTVRSNNKDGEQVYFVPQNYNVTLTVKSDKGCVSSTSNKTTIFPLPTPDFAANVLAGCPPLSTTFTANTISVSPITSVKWDYGNNTTGTGSPASTTYYESGKYKVKLTVVSADGCTVSTSKSAYIDAYTGAVAGFTASPNEVSIFTPDIEFIDESTNAANWEWYFGDGETSSSPNPTHTYSDTGTYNVTQIVTNVTGCNDTLQKKVTILPEFMIYIPNAFSPNGDQKNDTFNIKSSGIDETEYELLIFNRYGKRIFKSNDPKIGWDGEGKKGIESGVYVYKIELRDVKRKRHSYTGRINLIR